MPASPVASFTPFATRLRPPSADARRWTRSLTGPSRKSWTNSTTLVPRRGKVGRRPWCVASACLPPPLPLVRSPWRSTNGQGRRPVTEMEPSAEVKALLGMANRHYAMGEHEEALKHLTEVVRIDPTIRGPWYTLATIHEERGDKEKAVMFKIVANHLSSAKSAAVEWAELGSQSRCDPRSVLPWGNGAEC